MRHTTWFNATMHINNFIMGLVASMEKQNSEDENFDASSITAVKASLMGPLSGIGDSSGASYVLLLLVLGFH